MRGQVVVRLRQEVLDPQGVTIAKALRNLGYEGVGELRQGKIFDVELDTDDADKAEAMLQAMASELLANPVIESFEVRVLDGVESASADGSADGTGKGPGDGPAGESD